MAESDRVRRFVLEEPAGRIGASGRACSSRWSAATSAIGSQTTPFGLPSP